MRAFKCSCETQPKLFFESTTCETCGRLVGFSDTQDQILAFDPVPDSPFFTSASQPGRHYRQCANYAEHRVCNGMIEVELSLPAEQQPQLCFACHFNQTIPDLSVPAHLPLWRKLETAKRRTLFTLKELKLPLPDREQSPETGLCFHFLADKTAADHFRSLLPDQKQVFTGHDQGEITINLAEADEVARTDMKNSMGEQYRTLLGHFRHEIGHYFWDQIVSPNADRVAAFKKVFGDPELDYQAALDRHYKEGPPTNWRENYISAYATMHPWEDWAETWAHYLHMLDTLETAQSFGLQIKPSERPPQAPAMDSLKLPQQVRYYDRQTSIDAILATWIRFSVILNALNHSMGLPDAYPFVLYPTIRDKIKFVHDCVHGGEFG